MESDSQVITRLSHGKRDPTRVNVFLNGKFAFSISADEVIKHGLKSGHVLAEREVAVLSTLSDEEKVFAKIINFISYRPRSKKEVKDRLYKYLGPDQDKAKEAVIAKLDRLGYLNDLEFARWFAQSRANNRPRSTRQLAGELYVKGLSKDVIAQVLEEFADDRAAIRALIDKKQSLEKDKLVAYLARKGFSWEVIKDELDKRGREG